jgi:hypothetical protein
MESDTAGGVADASAKKDWADTGRYLNVVRIDALGKGPAGNATDFPIWSKLSDEQILEAFVSAVCGITGCKPSLGLALPDGPFRFEADFLGVQEISRPTREPTWRRLAWPWRSFYTHSEVTLAPIQPVPVLTCCPVIFPSRPDECFHPEITLPFPN